MAGDAGDPKLRLFVAVEVPAAVRSAVDAAAAPLRRVGDARWTDPAGWHLTLAFLGWVERARAADAERAVAAAARAVEPFALALTGSAGMFRSGVLWVALADSQALAGLAGAVRDELRAAGFAIEDRPFHAHLTLARASRGTRLPSELAGRYAGPTSSWPVDRILLMRSELRRGGARYSEWAAWPLGRQQQAAP